MAVLISGSSQKKIEVGGAAQRFENELLAWVIRHQKISPHSSLLKLGSTRECAKRFGVSFYVAHRVLKSWAEKERLKRQGNAWHITTVSSGVPLGETILLIGRANYAGEFAIFSARIRRFVDALEKDCSRRGLRFIAIGYQGDNIQNVIDRLRKVSGVMGVVIWLGEWCKEIAEEEAAIELLKRIRNLKKPIAVLDEWGRLKEKAMPKKDWPFSRHEGIVFRFNHVEAGSLVARSVQSLGIKRLVFLSIQNGYSWSKQRCLGAKSTFKAQRLDFESFTLDFEIDKYDMAYLLSGMSAEQYVMIWSLGGSAGSLKERIFHFTELKRKLGGHPILSEARRSIARSKQGDILTIALKTAQQRILKGLAASSVGPLKDRLFDFAAEEAYRRLSDLQFAKAWDAFKDPSHTAWICDNDLLASFAKKWIANKIVRASHQKRFVIGFDNEPRSCDEGFTSFDFNLEETAKRCLDFLTSPRHFRPTSTDIFNDIPGRLVFRNTIVA